VGNAWTDDTIDSNSVPGFIWGHGLCSFETWQEVSALCGLDKFIPGMISREKGFSEYSFDQDSKKSKIWNLKSPLETCNQALNKMNEEVGNLINQYDIYWPCIGGVGLDCMNYTAQQDYLNRYDVKIAIHANTTLPWSWQVCGGSPLFNYTESWNSVIGIYPKIMSSLGPRVTVYSGDVTFNVPFSGSEIWIESLGRPIVSGWKNWLVGGQVAGFVQKYDLIHFVTVFDAGHMVATYQPERAEILFYNYLHGDVTFNVPFSGSEIWIESLGRPIVSGWKNWLVGGQVAGFVQRYDLIHFVTVFDAGHMVATYQPERAEIMFYNYLHGIF